MTCTIYNGNEAATCPLAIEGQIAAFFMITYRKNEHTVERMIHNDGQKKFLAKRA